MILTHLVPEAGNDDGDVTDATNDHEEDIGDSKAVVAHSGHSLVIIKDVHVVQELWDVEDHGTVHPTGRVAENTKNWVS